MQLSSFLDLRPSYSDGRIGSNLFPRSYLTTIWDENQWGAFSAMFPWNITCENRYFVRFSVYLRPVSPFFCTYGRWSSRQYEIPSPKFGPIFPNIVCNFWERKVTGVALCLWVIIAILQKKCPGGPVRPIFLSRHTRHLEKIDPPNEKIMLLSRSGRVGE